MNYNTIEPEDFTISIVDGIPVLKFNIFRATVKEVQPFQQHLAHLMSANHRFIIVDFSDCAFIDSAIVGVMLTVIKDIRKNKGDMFTVTSPGTVDAVFSQTGLDRIFKKFPNVSSALANINL
jgi:anti-sigma B factor antagonist